MTASGSLIWSNREPPIAISSAAELDRALDQIAIRLQRDRPIIATLAAHDAEALIGVGADLSFVQLQSANGDGPYWITSSSTTEPDVVAFWLHGDHHTEVPRRYLLAPSGARAALREFLASGTKLPGIAWVEVGS